ncbi:putative mucin TcMUCII [Trypanosoma cruzi]|uniref:Putative mucin TcMUCII n=1 Tax=Trypanosoma cruzi TaxID=5693 RepID=A0A2V2V0X8_TRYCR|nr:putative mucin TcMUCII [Trypanosoma cruzi]
MNIGCTSRGPTIHVVCGDLPFNCYFAFVLLSALLLLCVCVPSVRGADKTDRSRRVCMRWSLVCRSCLLLPPPSVCCCCGRAVCVCACCRGLECVCAWCAAYGACLAAALSSCGVPLCVSAAPLVSPVAPMSLTVQISSTPLNDHTHDDDVPSAVRPVGARLCCCPSVCVTANGEQKIQLRQPQRLPLLRRRHDNNTTTTTTTKPTNNNDNDDDKSANHYYYYDDDDKSPKTSDTTKEQTKTAATSTEAPIMTTTKAQLIRMNSNGRSLAVLTAASAALRGCVPCW